MFAAEPGLRGTDVRVYAIVVGALVMAGLVSAAAERLPSGGRPKLERALTQRDEPADERPAQLERLEREVTLAVSTAHDLHVKLLPQLREIARARLEQRGLRPGPETLGDWWELLRPDRPPPENRFAAGIAEADLRALVADLERL